MEDDKNHQATPPVTRERVSSEAVAEFIISLIQAFLRTGYYLPEHPESKKAKAGLHEKFVNLTGDSGEITFMLREEGAVKNIFIEGVERKTLRLKDMMTRGMSEAYNPRFVNFLERKELISLSLSSRMAPEEFSLFVDVMSEPSLLDMREHAAKEAFVASIRERGVSNISFVFNEDFITARRGIPWRACMALSRLRKDFKMIPIFRDLKEEDLAGVRGEILMEIMRPLAAPELVYAFLMNIDLAATEDMNEETGEDEVLSIARESVLVDLAELFVKDASGEVPVYREILPTAKFNRILGKLAVRMNQVDIPEAKLRLEEMFSAGLLSLEDLPPEVRQSVMTIQMAVSFVEQRENYLKHLDRATDPEDYSRRAHTLAGIIPYLLERGRCLEAVSIIDGLMNHGMEESNRAIIARETLAWIVKGDALDNARSAFTRVPKEERLHLARFFVLMGEWGVPHLLRIITESDDRWRSKQAAEILFQIGPKGAAALLYEMERGHLSPGVEGTVIRVLGECSDEKLKAAVIRAVGERVDDLDDTIRQEVLQALSRLDPQGSSPVFLGKMEDPHPGVRKSAIRGLGLSGDTSAIKSLWDLVLLAEETGSDWDLELAGPAIEALGRLLETSPAGKEEISSLLLGLAEREYPGGRLKKMVGARNLSPPALVPLAEAMGRIGGDQGRRVLSRMARDREKTVSRKAAEVLKKMDG